MEGRVKKAKDYGENENRKKVYDKSNSAVTTHNQSFFSFPQEM